MGRLGEKAQDRQTDHKAVGRGTPAQPKGDRQGIPLRPGQPIEPIEYWRAELMKRGIGQLPLGFHPRHKDDRQIRCRADGIVQERRLPDPGFTPDDERASASNPRVREQPVKRCALVVSTDQRGEFRSCSGRRPGDQSGSEARRAVGRACRGRGVIADGEPALRHRPPTVGVSAEVQTGYRRRRRAPASPCGRITAT